MPTAATTSATTLTERRRRQTRMDIALVAFDLFERRGFEATTVKDIASAAEISERTFFRYFPNKDDVALIGGVDLEGMAALLDERPADEPLNLALRRCLERALEHTAVNPRVARVLASEPALRARWLQDADSTQDVLAAAVGRRLSETADSLIPRLVAATFVAMTQVIWEMTTEGRDGTDLVRQATVALGHGLFDRGTGQAPEAPAPSVGIA